MENLDHINVSDVVYLIDHNTIIKLQVTRVTKKQIVLENEQKFWKTNGDKVGDISSGRSRIYSLDHPLVTELYEKNIDVYTVVEWLYQLQTLIIEKKNLNLDELKDKFEELYDLIYKYDDY